ncbi:MULTISPECIES: choloylglycine hydrolase family protein [Francisella]|uniref:Linear amide C-N hydrolase n=1 Tax=Francisella opportunistica TaxID=2016517 RepID=A0A345JQJ8_9GAMM|nr:MULTISPECIES: choloylglycine hydrolase family protein [Francisella]APC91299.1 Choloylglycine hydrolase family protein [Francisella sp. MA067296]AXH29594.1 linear amide C-N hydrolase [Francisella opportunistica]AXH31245.1 linear amide C-N hydrolase [Francisella opportunistica]AXH32892.1 linear amide C-N hydrolase [Francisella opportunistica]
MKLVAKKIFVCCTALFMLFSQSLACTALTLVKNGNTVSGRTMEWGFKWNWQVIYMPKGSKHYLTAPSNLSLTKLSYSSKYSIIGTGLVNTNQEFLVDGQNDQGLSISANYMPGFTEYQKVTNTDKKYAFVTEISILLLSEYANVDQVKQALEQYKVWSDKSTMFNGVAPQLHFLITDKNGKGLVVEYINGKVKLYDVNSNVKVMTNAPTYDWHLINLRNYLNLNNQSITKVKISDAVDTSKGKDTQDINSLGQGNGFLGLPGDYSPPSRFIKTAILGYYANNKGDNNENLVTKVTHILNNVDIAKGTVVDNLGNQTMFDHTIFTVIKDLNNNKLYIKSYNSPNNAVEIDLNTLDQNNSKGFAIDIDKLPYPNNNITANLIK